MASSEQPEIIELEHQVPDLERQSPEQARKYPWQRSPTSQSDSTAVNSDSGSVRSNRTVRSVLSSLNSLWWTQRPVVATCHQPQDQSPLAQAKAAFLLAITGEPLASETLEIASTWYINFLEAKIRESWVVLFCALLGRVVPFNETLSNEDLCGAFRLLEVIASQFKREDLALSNIVDTLYNRGCLKETDDERSDANRLAFAAFGWISILYTPRPLSEIGHLEIVDPYTTDEPTEGEVSRRPRRQASCTRLINNHAVSLEYHDQPLRKFLKHFGSVIPTYERSCFGSQSPMTPQPRAENWIEASLLCFQTLHRVVSVKIEWVESLSLHLEFDSRAKTLKLFKWPSLCLVMHGTTNGTGGRMSALSQIFWDPSKVEHYLQEPDDVAKDYFREVLLSYRLIFSQDAKSHQAFRRLRSTWASTLNGNPDPLLDAICGQHCEGEDARSIWDEIGADEPSSHYSPSDFIFLGKRLLNVQRYVKGHKPRGFVSLWFDQRDPSNWWNLWAVIVLGGGALLFALISVALQVVQVVYAQQQVRQQTYRLAL